MEAVGGGLGAEGGADTWGLLRGAQSGLHLRGGGATWADSDTKGSDLLNWLKRLLAGCLSS